MGINSIRILTRLRFRQFFLQKNKGLEGKVVFIVYFWFLEILLYFMLRKEGVTDYPPLLVVGVCLTVIFPDILYKVIFLHDETVMDAFIKTRPIPQGSWDRFLTLSQFWKSSNLAMPLIMAPACFLFLRFPYGIVIVLLLYLLSVFGGFIVMLMKHRGNYPAETSASFFSTRFFKLGLGGDIWGIQSRSFFRSNRLKTSLFALSAILLFQFLVQGSDYFGPISNLFLFGFIFIHAITIPQFGMGIEANFFSGIWTKPLYVSKILSDKFWFSAILAGLSSLLALPFCVRFHIPYYRPLAYALFSIGAGELMVLVDAYNCKAFDLFGKPFFNYQGTSSAYRASSIMGMLVAFLIPILLPSIIPEWATYLIMSGLGFIGILFHRPFFRWVERKFMKNKYKYMEKYLSI